MRTRVSLKYFVNTCRIKEWGEKIKRRDLIQKTNKYKHGCQQYETIRSFGECIYAGKIAIDEAEEDQTNLLKSIVEFSEKFRPRTKQGKDKKEILIKVHILFMKDENLNAFKSGIFSIQSTQGKRVNILTPKQILQRLPIAFVQVKTSNTSETLLNEIRQIIYSSKSLRKCITI